MYNSYICTLFLLAVFLDVFVSLLILFRFSVSLFTSLFVTLSDSLSSVISVIITPGTRLYCISLNFRGVLILVILAYELR